MPTINLVLAGVPFEIETPSLRLTALFADYYRYYDPGVIYDRGTELSSARIRLELESVDELPKPADYLPPAARLVSQTGVLGFWECEKERGGATEYYFRTEVAAFHVDPKLGLIRGVVAEAALNYPHILANTYSLFPILLVLRSLGWYHLHAAAAISPRGRVWLIPGSQRSGKTTIVTALGLAGWRPISDDSLFLRQTSGEGGDDLMEIVPLRKYFHLGNELLSRWRGLDGILRGHSYLDRTCVAAVEFFGLSLKREDRVQRVDYLLMPEITGEARSRLRPVPASDGLLMLGEQSVFLQMWREHTLCQWRNLERIARGASSLKLDSGIDLLEDPSEIARILEEVESGCGELVGEGFRPSP